MEQTKTSKNPSSDVVTSSKSGGRQRSRRQTLVFGAGFVVLLAVAVALAVALFKWHDQNKAYVQAGDYSISHKQYDLLKKQAASDKATNETFSSELAALAKRRGAADSLKIKPSQAEIDDSAKKLYAKTRGLNEWQQLNSYNKGLDAAATRLTTGAASGSIFIFPFSAEPDRSVVTGTRPPTLEQYNQYKAQRNAYEKSSQYALEQAKAYRAALVSKKKDDATVIKLIMADKQFGGKSNKSTMINSDSTAWVSDSFYSPIAGTMLGLGKTGYSAVTLSVKASAAAQNKQLLNTDTYFYFYNLTSIQKPRQGLVSQFLLAQEKQEVNLHIPKADL